MRSDEYEGWQESPRGRRAQARYETDPELGRARHGRDGQDPDGQDWSGELPPWDSGAGYQPGSGGYQPDWSAEQPRYGGADPGRPDPRQADPGRTDPRGSVPDYFSQPGVYGGGYPAQQAGPGSGGYGEQPYGGPYDDSQSYPGQPGYDRRDPYEGRDPYSSQELYNGREAFGEQQAYGGQDTYREHDGYETGPYSGDRGYQQDQAGYGQSDEYDGYGAAAGSGPLQSYADDGYGTRGSARSGWQDQEDGISTTRGRGGSAGGAGGGRRGRPEREMDADDERHSAFFAGYASDDGDHYGGRPRRRRRGRAAGTIALVLVLVLLVGAAGAAYHFYSQYKARHANYVGDGFGSVLVTVPDGASADSIASELLQKNVIASVEGFDAYVSSKPAALQPGEFKLHEHMSPAAAWTLLISPGSRVDSTVTIPDGFPIPLILKRLAQESRIPLSQFQSAIKDTSALGLPSYANGDPEGYLYPDTYDIVPGTTTALQILQRAVQQFNTEVDSLNLATAARTAQFTEAQVITEASLLEGEVGPQYYADVARTLDNRLNINMPLELDSTVSFATGDYNYNLSSSQLQVNSPYNTFIHDGLPPGPINSPDEAAIEAVLHPASGSNDWIYFCTVNKSGLTYFTDSESQFEIWSAEAQKNLG